MNKVKQLKLSELHGFINSDEYKNLDNLPISFHRAISYLNNMRANANDIVLLMIFIENKLIAYRSLFSDGIILNNLHENFAWISGSWVHPDYRRKGYSEKILYEALIAWDNKLMFSNYAPESKSLYDKSKRFVKVYETIGKRFYFRFSFAELLKTKHMIFRKITFLLNIIDYTLNIFLNFKFALIKHDISNINYQVVDDINNDIERFIQKHSTNNPFKRNKREFSYFDNFPWVIEKSEKDFFNSKYYFSSTAKRFYTKKIVLFDEKKNITAFMILKVREKALSVPYLYFEKSEIKNISKIILHFVSKLKINYLPLYCKEIEKELLQRRTNYIFAKKSIKKFYSTEKLSKILGLNKYSFQDGDGDSIFT